jgi:hypothetical protein
MSMIQAPIVETQDPSIVGAWYALFLSFFPEFSDTTLYPKTMVDAWIPPSVMQMNQYRFGDQYNLAVCLYIAHNVVLSAREYQASHSGKSIVGDTRGPTSSKSIDKVSVSYDSGASSIDGAGAYNATSYGQRLYKLIQSFASGPFYVPGPTRLRIW